MNISEARMKRLVAGVKRTVQKALERRRANAEKARWDDIKFRYKDGEYISPEEHASLKRKK